VLDFYGGDGGSGGVGEEAEDAGVGEEGDVGEIHDLANAVDVGVGFGVDEAGIAVAGIAANALAGGGVGSLSLRPSGMGKVLTPSLRTSASMAAMRGSLEKAG
jgi:hypothetical protein